MTEKEVKEIIKKIEEYLDNAEMSNKRKSKNKFCSFFGGKKYYESEWC